MTIPGLQISAFRCRFAKKKLPHNQLWPEIAKFIVNLHRFSVPNAMERSDLALDAPDDSDTTDLG